jgi:hypothetical protein
MIFLLNFECLLLIVNYQCLININCIFLYFIYFYLAKIVKSTKIEIKKILY